MFKIILRRARPGIASGVSALALLAALLPLLGCRTVTPLPPVNLGEPGWNVRQGQAVWRLPTPSREIAGELIVATRPDGAAFVQFTKTPFPFVVAQQTRAKWQIEFPAQNRRYSGPGTPPKRLIWLWLPRVLAGQEPPKNWVWRQEGADWHLTNSRSGESLAGYFGR